MKYMIWILSLKIREGRTIHDFQKNWLWTNSMSEGRWISLKKPQKKRYRNFEKEHSVKLPTKFKEWLLFSDGEELFLPAGIQLYGIDHKPVIDVDNNTNLLTIILLSVHLHQEILFYVKKQVKKSLFIIRKLEELKMMIFMMTSYHFWMTCMSAWNRRLIPCQDEQQNPIKQYLLSGIRNKNLFRKVKIMMTMALHFKVSIWRALKCINNIK